MFTKGRWMLESDLESEVPEVHMLDLTGIVVMYVSIS